MNSIEEEIKEQPLDDPYGVKIQSNMMQLNNNKNEFKQSRSLKYPKMRFSSFNQHASSL